MTRGTAWGLVFHYLAFRRALSMQSEQRGIPSGTRCLEATTFGVPQAERVQSWALAITELPSVSGSAKEAAFPAKLAAVRSVSPQPGWNRHAPRNLGVF
jgi:hypothetical protein